ncbi:hypothetical protein GG344DRAFT_82328 [Lentinula edodes]|nr:hypothetical protein GG344DRAFT_82328 [Lentinula edodes]
MAGQQGMMTPQMQPTNPPGGPPPLEGPIQCRNSLANFHQRQLGGGGAGSPSDPGSTFGGGPNAHLAVDFLLQVQTSVIPEPRPNSGPHPGMPSLPPPNMDPSPGSMLGNTPMPGMSGPMSGMPNGIGPGSMGSGMVGINSGINAMNGTGSDIPFFGSDFMNDIEVGGLDTFDPNLFRDPGGVLNFERDFGLSKTLPHAIRPPAVSESEHLLCMTSSLSNKSSPSEVHVQCVPLLPGYLFGVGDLFSSLVLAHYNTLLESSSLELLPPFRTSLSGAVSQALTKTHAVLDIRVL